MAVLSLRHFSPVEFRCKCGCGAGMEKMDADLLQRLDEARDLAGIPFPLSSAYRCPKHNKAVGGVPTSSHTRGYAVDIRCVDSHSRFVMLQALLEAGFRRVELAPTWIHVDNDPDKPRRNRPGFMPSSTAGPMPLPHTSGRTRAPWLTASPKP